MKAQTANSQSNPPPFQKYSGARIIRTKIREKSGEIKQNMRIIQGSHYPGYTVQSITTLDVGTVSAPVQKISSTVRHG